VGVEWDASLKHVRYRNLFPSWMMLTTHFYPFLTIFLRAHAPIIISSYFPRARFEGGSGREREKESERARRGRSVPPSGAAAPRPQKSSSGG
jgi:hypothetical protein